ncbi:MAG TPA: ATP-binding protein [Vicinamibacterales bacterium]
MGETRVDLQHLLEDLRDAYSGAIEQTILTEIVANALDSGATRIRIAADPAAAALTVVDDGRGMQRRELARYHDIAASTKARGDGIGFAGVGIKLGLLVSREVITETRRGATHVATRWHLKSRHRAPWKWIDPPGMTPSRGTAVRLVLENPLSPLLDASYLEEAVRSHFAPLFDGAFDEILRRAYLNGIVFDIGGCVLDRLTDVPAQRAALAIRLGRRRIPSAVGFVERHTIPQHEDQQGIAISTFGKVIRRGWDWLGLTPANASRISGLIEVPDLAACLTLNKSDFIRAGSRGATYLAYRKAIQEVASRQLAAWGDAPEHDVNPRTERLERDLERVIDDLADDFPLLRSLVDRRAGGQKRLPMPGRGAEQVPGSLFGDTPAWHGGVDAASRARERLDEEPLAPAEESAPPEEMSPSGERPQPPTPEPELPARPPSSATTNGGLTASGPIGTLSAVPGRRRPARYGLLVQFESRPGEPELGRLVDSTIWINDAHPAYVRAAASRSSGYHLALSVALALAPLAVEPAQEHAFVTQFLSHWGSSSNSGRPGRRRRRPRPV